MRHNQSDRFWHSAAQSLLGSLGLAVLTFIGYRLQLNLATVCLLYLIVVVLVSLTSGFVPSAFVSLIAIACLNYFFVPPLFDLRVDEPLDAAAVLAFLTTALVIFRPPLNLELSKHITFSFQNNIP